MTFLILVLVNFNDLILVYKTTFQKNTLRVFVEKYFAEKYFQCISILVLVLFVLYREALMVK